PDRTQVRPYGAEPVRVLGQRAQDLAAAPFGETFERDVWRCAVEVHVGVNEDATWVDGRENEFGVEPLGFEEIKLERGREREVRGENNVGDGHALPIPPSGGACTAVPAPALHDRSRQRLACQCDGECRPDTGARGQPKKSPSIELTGGGASVQTRAEA